MTDLSTQEYYWWRIAMDVGGIVLAAGVGFYVWIKEYTGSNRKQISTIEKCQRENKERLISIEAVIAHLPDDGDISRLHRRADSTGQGLRALEGQMKQINTTLTLIQQHLMSRSNKS
jgi:hypothetical protein